MELQWIRNACCVDETPFLNLAVQVISVEPPNTVELEVVETDPGVKGNTAVGDLQMRVAWFPGLAGDGHPARQGGGPAPETRATPRWVICCAL